jgi:hypothetical protein
MNIKAVIIVACLAVATPAVAQSRGEVITPNFERAIPNIPGKSLVAVVVDYAPGGASHPHTHASQPSSTPMSSRAPLKSESTTPAKVCTNFLAPIMLSVVTRARRRARKAARGVRRRYRRQGTDHTGQIIPDQLKGQNQ